MRKLRRDGDESPEFGVGTLMQVVSPNFVTFQNFKHQIASITMQQKAYHPMTMTEYSLLPKSASSTSTKSPLHVENLTFSGEDTDKNTAQNAPKHYFKLKI